MAAPDATAPDPTRPPPPGVTRVLFCGRDMHFGWRYTADAAAALPAADRIQVLQCDRGDVAAALSHTHVAVPLMSRLDGGMLRAAAASASLSTDDPASGTASTHHNGLLRHVIQYGVGVEGVDLAAAAVAGISVHNIPSSATPNAASCAEMAIYLALAVLRRAPELAASLATRRLGAPPGRMLGCKTALILGWGGIARELAPRLRALGVTVDAVRRSAWDGEEEGGAVACLRRRGAWSDLAAFTPDADIAFVTCAQNEATRNVIGADFWQAAAKSPRGVIVINVARGGLLDPAAAAAALASGACAGLGLDVQWEEPVDPGHPLLKHERVVATPHVAGVTEESYRAMAAIVAADAAAVAAGGRPLSPLVNGPVAGWE